MISYPEFQIICKVTSDTGAKPDTIAESKRASARYSTYSDREVQEIVKKIEACRDRFITQGSGTDRARCLCSIFEEIKAGNGGSLPRIDDWERMYNQLCGHDNLGTT